MSRLTPLCAGRLSSHLGAGAAARTAVYFHAGQPFAPCFRIVREEGKYKRLRNADKFQARVSKIRKALAETSTRPVTFHEEVCLGGDE